ncbi:DNA polymerase I [Arthrobacter phage Jasmine]|uniref:DNA polymerase I n=1 Tax=Arthrobacter phage Jasmine TaxID=1772302 RepID=A0A0U4K041_9CAUD|nr:DNA polymerase I [Arthrobacter phage Jasmine]ALY09308.1 DNA polymerase I [Arthrobacter phage Jasmine]
MLQTGKRIPLSNLGLDQWLALIRNAKLLAFDTETTGLKVHSGEDTMLGFSIALRTDMGVIGEYFPMYHKRGVNLDEEDAFKLLDAIAEKPLAAHNIIFDKNVLHHAGYPNVEKFYCTQRIAHLLDENSKQYSLDAVSLRFLGYAAKEKDPDFELALLAYGWAGMPSEIMHKYAKADAVGTFHTLEAQMKNKEFTPQLLNYWQKIGAPTLSVLSKMRRLGVRIDVDRCKREQETGEQIMAEIEDRVGGKPSSSKFLQRVLIEELGLPQIISKKTGNPTFDKEAMKRYDLMLEREEKHNGLAKEILTYRGWQKAVSGYYLPYQRFVERDGRLRAEYKPFGTVTGRFSCADPNLQQIPKETDKAWNGAVKSCLIPADGYKLWELDYSQLEFRLAAAASREEGLLEIFNDGQRDIFTEMAAQLEMERQDVKTLTYSIQYGGGVQRIMDVFGVSKSRATEIIANFYERYPNLKKAGNAAGRQVASTGKIGIWSGRARHFKYPGSEYYKAFNSYVQGGAADLVTDVMVKADREIANEECRMLLQVHDSLVWEIAIGKEQYYLPEIEKVMTSPQFGVHLAVDAHAWSK